MQRQSHALRAGAAESGCGAPAHGVWECVSGGEKVVRLVNVAVVMMTDES